MSFDQSETMSVYVKLIKNYVNLRSGPSMSAKRLALMPVDTVLLAKSKQFNDNYIWYEVNYNGQNGYVREDVTIEIGLEELKSLNLIPVTYTDASAFETKELDDGTLCIVAYIGTDTIVRIPPQINGKTVRIIGRCAFEGCRSLEEITLPDSVTDIEEYSFFDCTSLKQVNLPRQLSAIGSNPFEGCENLSTITIPENLEWITFKNGCLIASGYVLIGYFKPGSITAIVPDGVTAIGDHAFFGCVSLKEIVLPDSVTSIEHDAFDACSSDLVLHVAQDSYAEQWARENDMNYEIR